MTTTAIAALAAAFCVWRLYQHAYNAGYTEAYGDAVLATIIAYHEVDIYEEDGHVRFTDGAPMTFVGLDGTPGISLADLDWIIREVDGE